MPEVPERPTKKIHPLRDALLAGICTFVVSVVGLTILYRQAADAQFAAVRNEMLQMARTMAAEVDGDLHKTLVSPEQQGSPDHLRLLEPLARMHRAARDVWFVYTGVYRDGRIHWVLDSANLYRIPGNEMAPDPIMKLYEEREPEYEAAFRDGVEFADLEPREEDGHSYLSAAAPIRDRAGNAVGLLGLDMVLDGLDARMAGIRRVLYIALGVVCLLSIAAGAIAHRLRRFAVAIVRELHKSRATAERHAESAEAAARAKATFLAMMSHEIRTPMNGMLGVADLLRAKSHDAEQRKLLDILAGSGESLLRIINDILDFSKIEAERLELRPRPFELRGLLEELETLLSTQACVKHITFSVEADPRLPVAVTGDRQRLSQVLLNLGNNAVKFTDRGSVRLVVNAVTNAKGEPRIEFIMHDTGIGMSALSLEQLFKPFGQVGDTRANRAGGTGLGLVISQKLVHLMGGEITVTSELKKGSSFRFDLDLPAAEFTAANTTTARVLRLEGLSVLVAEDNTVNQLIIEAMLKQLGHRVMLTGSGRQALEALARDDFDLVLMDCNMPELDGLEATRQLRAGASGVRDPRIPVIALTANALDGDRETCLAAGMNDFLAKPVSMIALRLAIERVRSLEAELDVA